MFTLDVYSNEQWKTYPVQADRLADLRAYAERVMAADDARGEHGVYHNFDWNDPESLNWDDPELVEFDKIIHPADYETCPHGMSANLCYGPAHYASDYEISQGW